MSTTPTTPVALTSPSQAAKAILFVFVALATSVIQVQGHISLPVLLALVLQFLTLVPVFGAEGTRAKVIVTFVSAFVQALIVVVGNTLSYGDLAHISWITWLGLAVSAFAGIGIAYVPNKPLIDARDTNPITTAPLG